MKSYFSIRSLQPLPLPTFLMAARGPPSLKRFLSRSTPSRQKQQRKVLDSHIRKECDQRKCNHGGKHWLALLLVVVCAAVGVMFAARGRSNTQMNGSVGWPFSLFPIFSISSFTPTTTVPPPPTDDYYKSIIPTALQHPQHTHQATSSCPFPFRFRFLWYTSYYPQSLLLLDP